MNKKIIIITGVTRGLGRALSDQYLKMGHTVIGCGRNAEIIKKCLPNIQQIQIFKL